MMPPDESEHVGGQVLRAPRLYLVGLHFLYSLEHVESISDARPPKRQDQANPSGPPRVRVKPGRLVRVKPGRHATRTSAPLCHAFRALLASLAQREDCCFSVSRHARGLAAPPHVLDNRVIKSQFSAAGSANFRQFPCGLQLAVARLDGLVGLAATQ